VAIFDCLEFDRNLRLVDIVDEIGYLGLECALLGHPEVGAHLGAFLAKATGDTPPPALAGLYTAFRALLRARLALAHLLDPNPRDPGRWAPLAARYLGLADEALG
jgi:aminoglycoside phosphotransferase family enzyme